VLKDLIVDRTAFDRIIAAGGFVSVATGSAPDGNALPIRKERRRPRDGRRGLHRLRRLRGGLPERLASLFVSAKLSHLGLLPQGQPERHERVPKMVAQMDAEGFGHCTNHGECEAVCPKDISVSNIARMNRDYLMASLERGRRDVTGEGGAG
jgi:succinate dehydrogenase / fumarate reductase iron-sulfur subunit